MVKPDGIQRISKIDTYLNVAEAFASNENTAR